MQAYSSSKKIFFQLAITSMIFAIGMSFHLRRRRASNLVRALNSAPSKPPKQLL